VITLPMLWLPRGWTTTGTLNLTFNADGNTGVTKNATVANIDRLSPSLLVSAIVTALNAAQGGSTFFASLDPDTKRLIIGRSSGTFRFRGGTLLPLLGLTDDGVFYNFQMASTTPAGMWFPGEAVRSDSGDLPVVVEGFQRSLAGQHRAIEHARFTERKVLIEWVPEAKALFAPGGFGAVWDLAKLRFRWFPDASNESVWGDYFLLDSRDTWEPERMFVRPALYRVSLRFGKYLA